MPSKHFFVIGAQRSGTTYLYRMLQAHPQICMAQPERPEPKYFLRDDFTALAPVDYEITYFADCDSATYLGEKSTSYIEHERAAKRIVSWYPDAQIIVCLRHPVRRSLSNYYFTRQYGLEPLHVEAAFRTEDQRRDQYDPAKISVSPYAYLKRSRYMDYLPMWARYFGKDSLIPLIFERFTGQLPALQALYGQLGVDSSFVPAGYNNTINANEAYETGLAPDLLAYLRDYFREPVRALRGYLNDPIPEWDDLG